MEQHSGIPLQCKVATKPYSAATFLVNAGIPTLIDAQHAIAHNKVMVIDEQTVITGSFNFTKAAEEKNAENLLILTEAPELAKVYAANVMTHAGHSQPYQRSEARRTPWEEVRPASVSRDPTGAEAGAIRGNPKSKIYHLPTCPTYHQLNPTKAVPFASEAEAQRAGYRKAKNCP